MDKDPIPMVNQEALQTITSSDQDPTPTDKELTPMDKDPILMVEVTQTLTDKTPTVEATQTPMEEATTTL
jgi:hypothetical protein